MQTFPEQKRADLKARAQDMLRFALDAVLPPRCVISGDVVQQQGMIAPKAWAELDFISDPMCVSCGFPFDFAVEKEAVCTACLSYPPPFKSARSALKYGDSSRKMILGFKHADKTHVVRAFLPWLRRAGAYALSEADLIVPVPLHYRRLVSRRYNQAGIIATALAKDVGLDYELDCLRRVRATPSQGYLNAKERHKNVKRAFKISPRRAKTIQGKTIILVDDVYTTGATVKECAKVLIAGGAASVHILTVTRVARPEFSS